MDKICKVKAKIESLLDIDPQNEILDFSNHHIILEYPSRLSTTKKCINYSYKLY